MRHVEKSIFIQASPEVVLTYTCDPAHVGDWNIRTVNVSDVSDKVLQKGTTWKQAVKFFGLTIPSSVKILEYEPPRRVLMQVKAHIIGLVEARQEPRDGGVLLTIGYNYDWGFIPKGVLATVDDIISAELEESLKQLKKNIEQAQRSVA